MGHVTLTNSATSYGLLMDAYAIPLVMNANLAGAWSKK